MNKNDSLIRWIFLLPACILLYFLAYLLLKLSGFADAHEPNPEPLTFFFPFLLSAGTALFCISVGIFMAPSKKRYVGLILILSIFILAAIGIVILIVKGVELDLLLVVAGQIAGGIFGIKLMNYILNQKQKEE